MGMFDTVIIECPGCSAIVNCQTKSGGCCLDTYELDNAPMEVMAGLLGHNTYYECGATFNVSITTRPTYKVTLIEEGM
jgi:hypothetical protein